jgi:hypothetical protein
MEIVPIEIFGVAVDVPFSKPLGLRQARLEEFSAALCDPIAGLGLRPDQIRLRQTDELFQYELCANFFGENAWLTRTAERVKMGIRNARTAPDWKVITDLLEKFCSLVNPPREGISLLSTHAHARFPSTEERDQWLNRFAYTPLISRPASLGYVQIVDWEKEVRVLIEQSNAVPDAVFVAWDTQFSNDQDLASLLPRIPELMENSANLFDLGFDPLRRSL